MSLMDLQHYYKMMDCCRVILAAFKAATFLIKLAVSFVSGKG